jgi:putative copper resistance protein D
MMAEGLLKYLLIADAALIQCALGVMLAALASVLWVRGTSSTWGQAVRCRSRRWFLSGVAVALAANALMLWLQSAVMSDGSLTEASSMVPMMVNETHFGHAWMIGIGALAVAGAAGFIAAPIGLVVSTLATAAFAVTRSVVSHAGAQGDFSLEVATDWVHLMLTSLWVGMVFVGSFIALRQRIAVVEDRVDSIHWISSLSDTATVALVGILLTGVAKVWWATPSVGQLIASPYAAVLLVKVVLVGCAAALGGFNKFRVMPSFARQVQTADGALLTGQRFARILWIEAAVLVCAVVAAAVLSGTPTPGEG